MSDSELDDLLDTAAGALRDETQGPGVEDVTLARVQRTLGQREPLDDLLDEAIEALRDEGLEGDVDGTWRRIAASLEDAAAALREQTDGDAEGEATWARIEASLSGTEGEAPIALPTRRVARGTWAAAAAAALALLFGMPTAWAWSTGALPGILVRLDLMDPPEAAAPTPEPEPAPATRRPVRAPRPTGPEPEPVDEAVEAPAPTPVVASAPRPAPPPPVQTPTPRAEAPTPAPATEPAPAAPDEDTRAFSVAHDVHFEGGSPAASLAAWDDYLAAYPHGRYEPEARYNRALSLARLGRLEAARDALRPFADGSFRGYRRTEAARLIEALDARIEAP